MGGPGSGRHAGGGTGDSSGGRSQGAGRSTSKTGKSRRENSTKEQQRNYALSGGAERSMKAAMAGKGRSAR